VVIRNAGEIMWRSSMIARPGTVDVAVLPPVPTAGLAADDADELAEQIRHQFVETLDAWPV
jgi:putative phosphoserine phosphatase / 1-acylglycerol-3-phosphate O-acyltransferase